MNTAQMRHIEIMRNFLTELNKETDTFILKGGTSLLLAYGLDRFSEDIDLDGEKRHLKGFIESYSQKHGFFFRIAKDTPTVERFMLAYDPSIQKPLKIEISYRSRSIPANTHHRVNGIEVYTIDRICQLKTGAYQGRDKIRDLYDICFICDRYFEDLSESAKEQLKDALTYKGFDYFDYVTSTQDDALIDKDALAGLYLNMFEKLDLLYSEEEAKTISAKETNAEKEDDEQEDWRR